MFHLGGSITNICSFTLTLLLVVVFWFWILISHIYESQEIVCSLSTKVNQDFYDMTKTRVIIKKNFDVFTTYDSLFQNKILTIIYQSKTKTPAKNRKCLIQIKK